MMDDEPIELIDLWAERRALLATLIEQFSPEDALAVLKALVRDCPKGDQVGAYLSGAIIGQAQRRAK